MTTKEILRVNLFPNPDLRPTGLTSGLWGSTYVECFPGDGTLVVPAKTEGGSTTAEQQGYVQLDISGLLEPDAEYVLSAIRLSGTGKCGIQYNVSGLTFTTTDDGELAEFRFVPARIHDPSNLMVYFETGTWTRPSIELASTYDAAVSGGGLRFFAWDTMPRP